jgi:hypothetical protein
VLCSRLAVGDVVSECRLNLHSDTTYHILHTIFQIFILNIIFQNILEIC